MNALDRVVAGLSCRQVLEQLSDFLDGELPPERTIQLREHLKECRACEQFGGRVGALITTLRAHAPPAPPAAVVERLQHRLRQVPG
jgi:anti-sigma factor RsiW